MKKIGFIGAGNMGSAMLQGVISSSLYTESDVVVTDPFPQAVERIRAQFPGVKICLDNISLIQESDIIILAVKPQVYEKVSRGLAPYVNENKLFITIAAGMTISNMEQWLGEKAKIVRTMPNTPAMVGEGMAAYCCNSNVSEDEKNTVENIFNSFGRIISLPEKQINGFTAIAGSSPAWIYMIIESLADGAVLMGLPRKDSYEAAAQAVLGSAKMVLEQGKHPGELKDAVCSPGGTTIEALASLEKTGLRSSIIEAVRECTLKADALS